MEASLGYRMSSRPIRLHSRWSKKIKSEMRAVDTFWSVCRASGLIPRNTHIPVIRENIGIWLELVKETEPFKGQF